MDDATYDKVLALVVEGLPVSAALKRLKISSATFYRNLSAQRKLELANAKTAHTQYGVGHNRKCPPGPNPFE